MDPSGTSYGWISVRSDYGWNGPSSSSFLSTIAIWVDGRRKGIAEAKTTERIPVYPGRHTVRIYLPWWFLSPRITVNVVPGSTVYLRADIPRSGSGFYRRIVKGLIDPFHWMILEEIRNEPESLPTYSAD